MAKKRNPKTIWGPPAEKAIQFKVALKYIRPPIWRRIVLPDNVTLGQLHEAIQIAMGWHNYHMHSFRIGGIYYTSQTASDMEDMDMENEETVFLCRVVTRPKQKFIYEYDFGDSWEHDIMAEKMLPIEPLAKYPVCLAGARACPPEDCGSFPGYSDILEALKAPKKTKEQKKGQARALRLLCLLRVANVSERLGHLAEDRRVVDRRGHVVGLAVGDAAHDAAQGFCRSASSAAA